MEIQKELYPLIGTLCASFIGGIISFITLVLSKENKVSDFRQAWIDALRDDISQYLGLLYKIFPHINIVRSTDRDPTDKLPTVDELLHTQMPDWERLNHTISRIVLRLNPNEHEKMINLVKYSYTDNGRESLLTSPGLEEQKNNVLTEAEKILKAEWNRVKRGEPLFVITKKVAIGLTVAAAILLFVFVCKGLWTLIVS